MTTQNKNKEQEYLIKYFNFKKKKCYKFTDTNREAIQDCLDDGYSSVDLQKIVNEFDGDSLVACFDVNRIKLVESENGADSDDVVDIESRPVVTGDVTSQATASLGLLEKAMAQIFVETKGQEIADGIMANVEKKVADFITSEYGELPRKQVYEYKAKEYEVEGITHERFETILAFVEADEPVFLTGPAGTGKNVLCKQIADVLGLNFYFSNAVTQEYKITGFTDAYGKFQESQFYKAFKDGGLFFLDEMDASIPEVLIILNAAIANRYFDFPAPIGRVDAHENFRVIAAGNTTGQGASYEYVARTQIDSATLDRFALIEVGYCEAIEKAVAKGNDELVKFCRAFREGATKAGVSVIVSYRAIGRMAKMEGIVKNRQTLIRTCLTKGLERDDIAMIVSNMEATGCKYFACLKGMR